MSMFSKIDKNLVISAIQNNHSLTSILKKLGLSNGEYNRKQLKQFIKDYNVNYVAKPTSLTPLGTVTKNKLIELVKSSNTYAEVLEKLGYGTARNGLYTTLKTKIVNWNIDVSHMTHYRKCNNERATSETLFIKNSPHHRNTLRRYILNHKVIPYKCAICGNTGVWNGCSLTLTLDHINGNHNDNRLENLRFICPNCDSQQNTYGKKNKIRYYRELHSPR